MKAVGRLAHWVQKKHRGQLIKHTGDSYFTHLIAVAEMAGPVTLWGYEIGLCHDLLEDTETSREELLTTLIRFNYNTNEAEYITNKVAELTDEFTADAYPDLSREIRKEKEALRLCRISAGAQTVKYADLI